VEFVITYLLVTVIILVALDNKSKTVLASLMIGFTLIGNILAAYVEELTI
jgi:glycerol uptake facilitator-like aquaporin